MTETRVMQNLSTPASQPDAETPATPRNPYVGPRTFTFADRNWYFGREYEARDLLSLVIAERLTLFYAQSGAGKSSLLNTQLIPSLREQARYLVLPVGRVGGELPAGIDNVANIYTFNLLLSLDQNEESTPARFAQMPVGDFMAGLRTRDGQHYVYDAATAQRAAQARANGQTAAHSQPPHVLIIDQFEELVTTHPQRWREREAFFRQLGDAMRADPLLWVVLTLREDFIAPLDPFAHLVPGSLTNRFYMQRMGVDAALEAIKRPSEKAGWPFAPDVAETLVDNLRRIKVAGQTGEQLGQYIEPVQLQVVCYQLWENLLDSEQASPASRERADISATDLTRAGDVDTALADFYEDAIQAALQVASVNVSGRRLRTWFDEQLITEAGTRGTVYRGDETTAGMDNRAVDALQQRFLLRTELRAGGTWMELVHDRFVEPIQRANRIWLEEHQHPLTRSAQNWFSTGKDVNLLLNRTQLHTAQAQFDTSQNEFGNLEREFIQASIDATQTQRLRRQRLLISTVALLILILASLTTWALTSASYAREQQAQASYERGTAVAAVTAQSKLVSTTDARLQIAEGTRIQAEKLVADSANNISILLTSQAAAPVSTPTPTHVLQDTPTGMPDVADTPTVAAIVISPSPDVNLFATATFAAIQQNLAQIQIAQTSVAVIVPGSTISVGQVLRTKDWINVRRSPGYLDKISDDVIGQMPSNTPVIIVGGPLTADSITWWQIQGVSSESVAVTGWVAESISGEALLASSASSGISLAKPFDGDYPISQFFGENPEFYSQILYDGVPLKGNNKIDFAIPLGVSVMATDDGDVLRVGFEPGGFGNFILLRHEWGESLYAHLDRVDVAEGQIVQRGELLGLSGATGAAVGAFLSFGIRINPYDRTDGWGGFSDPLLYLNLD